MLGRSVLGIGHAIGQKWVYDASFRCSISAKRCAGVESRVSCGAHISYHVRWLASEASTGHSMRLSRCHRCGMAFKMFVDPSSVTKDGGEDDSANKLDTPAKP